jgi:hypothetical protein
MPGQAAKPGSAAGDSPVALVAAERPTGAAVTGGSGGEPDEVATAASSSHGWFRALASPVEPTGDGALELPERARALLAPWGAPIGGEVSVLPLAATAA